MKPSSTILFAAGGTGGHILPAITVAERLMMKLHNISHTEYFIEFAGAGGELEVSLYKKNNISYRTFSSSGVSGSGLRGLLLFFKHFLKSILHARRYMRERGVVMVVGFGGYPSVIPILAARSMGIPCCIFEQNGIFGKANVFLSLVVNKVFAVPYVRGRIWKSFTRVLHPVRAAISEVPAWRAKSDISQISLLVLGGSQGALSLNSAILDCLELLGKRGVHVVIQTGARDFERVKEKTQAMSFVEVFSFIDDMKDALDKADIIVCRAGAGTVSEITAVQRATVFVPLPIAHGHQKYNCMHLVKAGAAMMYEQNDQLSTHLAGFFKTMSVDSLNKMHRAFFDVPEIQGVGEGSEEINSYVVHKLTKGNHESHR